MHISSEKIFFHRDFPPLDGEPIGEHTIEAASCRVPGTMSHRDDPWRLCHDDLMAQARLRIEQELTRLGGDYGHVFDEAIESRRDDVKNEAWLQGRFDYVLYRRQAAPGARPNTNENTVGAGAQEPSAPEGPKKWH